MKVVYTISGEIEVPETSLDNLRDVLIKHLRDHMNYTFIDRNLVEYDVIEEKED